MATHDVRRRLLRRLASTSTPDPADSIDTPTIRSRRHAQPAAAVDTRSTVSEETFYRPVHTPDQSVTSPASAASAAAPPQLSPNRIRKRLPIRAGFVSDIHGRHAHAARSQTVSHAFRSFSPSSSSFADSIILQNSNDIIVRDPVTGEPDLVMLHTDQLLDESIEEAEAMDYRIRRHIRSTYHNVDTQLADTKLQALVKRDLKKMVQDLDIDMWMFEPEIEESSDMA
ncbi:hypothetical protein V1514DRAFT_323502 [Lipomyces japonicus]|uniref:uncharacterized protein n=1 Tax=Lipomyces japonicus TaxID=56871 RepID=UPI0034CD5A42